MRKITRTALTATAVAATATALTVAPAWASTIVVTMPGVPSPSVQPITGENSGTVAATAKSGGVLTCVDLSGVKALTATGTVKVGNPVAAPADPIGSVTGLTFSNCKVLNLPATVTPQNLPWSLSTANNTASGVTPGQLSGVRVVVNIPSIPCSATFQGSTATNGFINGTHTNPNPINTGLPSTLSLPITATNNLIATGVSATCPTNIVKNGDTATLAGTIKLRGVNSTNKEGPTVIRT
ncbi:hypothetical protein [Actinomadura chokoriensis]|uniref:Secreted protein n=1 Tax=Actinomadura chokoriensis TaxID=454156 RepID=A0ABV4R5S8_9ACTN